MKKHVNILDWSMRSAYLTGILLLAFTSGVAQTDLEALHARYTINREQGQLDSALYLAFEMQERSLDELGDTSLWYARSTYALAKAQIEQGDRENGMVNMRRASELFGKGHRSFPLFWKSLTDLGVLYDQAGQFSETEKYFLESLDARKQALGELHPDYAKALQDLGTLYSRTGDFSSSESYYKASLEVLRKSGGENDPAYVTNLMNIGVLYMRIGDFRQAEEYLLSCLEIQQRTLGPEHPAVIGVMNNLGVLYYYLGDFTRVEQYFLDALRITKITLGEDQDYANGIHNLGVLYFEVMGDLEKAKECFLACLEIRKKILGPSHPELAQVMDNLGIIFQSTGDFPKAEEYLLASTEIKRGSLGNDHPEFAQTMMNLGVFYRDIGNFPKAEECYLVSLDINQRILGDDHPNGALVMDNLIGLYHELMPDQDKALEYARKLLEISWRNIDRNFALLNAEQKEAYLKKIHWYFDSYESVAAGFPDEEPQLAAYNNALRIKGLVLQSVLGIRDIIEGEGSLEDRILYEDWRQKKQYLVDQYALPLSERATDLDSVEAAVDILERSLSKVSSDLSALLETPKLEMREVQKQLKPGELAIEFVYYYDFKDSTTWYDALVLDHKVKFPTRVRLCSENELYDRLNLGGANRTAQIAALYNTQSRGISPVMKEQSNFYDLLWEPLEHLFEGHQTIYYSPTGLLHELNLSAISIDPDTRMMDQYTLVRLSSTSRLVDREKKSANHTAAIFSGINYDLDDTQTEDEVSQDIELAPEDDWLAQTRGSDAITAWSDLPYTRDEGVAIRSTLSSADFSVRFYEGQEGTEERFKQLTQGEHLSPGVIHLATHGFFFPDVVSDEIVSEDHAYLISQDPMYRTGLILAGANAVWTGKAHLQKGGQDGILTAKEVSTMDLRNTELVVMSACETGLGEVKNQEGVFGLQRAFKMAGVRYILMSLWQVPDYQSKELMVTFYRYWIESGLPIPEAFNKAQMDMKDRYKDPYLWAGFVLME